LKVVIPTASYKAVCGDGQQVGVQPDVFVPITIEDVTEGRDRELEVLRRIIREERKSQP
jgi:hypothetical protein